MSNDMTRTEAEAVFAGAVRGQAILAVLAPGNLLRHALMAQLSSFLQELQAGGVINSDVMRRSLALMHLTRRERELYYTARDLQGYVVGMLDCGDGAYESYAAMMQQKLRTALRLAREVNAIRHAWRLGQLPDRYPYVTLAEEHNLEMLGLLPIKKGGETCTTL